MVRQEDREKIQALLKDTITLLCKNGLPFRSEFSIEALIGITLDKEDVFLVNINEIIKLDTLPASVTQQVPEMPATGIQNPEAVLAQVRQPRHNRRKRPRPKMDGSQSGHDEDSSEMSTENIQIQSDMSSMTAQGLDDSSSRFSQDSDAEPVAKHALFQNDAESNKNVNDTSEVIVKEETGDAWDDGDITDSRGYAITDVQPKVEVHEGYESRGCAITDVQPKVEIHEGYKSVPGVASASSGIWTPSEQLISIQEQYQAAARRAQIATVTSDTSGQSNNIGDNLDKSQLLGHPADLLASSHPADVLTSLCKQMLPLYHTQPTVFTGGSTVSSPAIKSDDSDHPYKCEVCGKRYMKRDGLVRHWKLHDTSLHPCRRCTLFFQTKEQLQNHIDTRHGPENLKHMCTVCGKKFDRPQLLKKHLLTRHEGDEEALNILQHNVQASVRTDGLGKNYSHQ